MEVLGNISNVIGLVTFLFSVGAWFYSKRVDKRIQHQMAQQEERINILLSDGEREIIVGQPRRKWLTRSELNGLLGLLPMKPGKTADGKGEQQPRYSFDSVDWSKVTKKIEEAQDSKINAFVIKCSAKELDQFKSDIIKTQRCVIK